ncbi:MAG TPA: oxidoreductase [Planctomycetaceae bacterium]|nr:oxidoreductase [Planctomycetaceae bacterium]
MVTGSGSRRVGRAIAMHLASLGCKIALHANTSKSELQAAANELRASGREVLATLGDLRDPDAVSAIINQVLSAFGRIDILVNSAAIWSPTRLEDVTADELRNYFDVNAVGAFIAARAAGLQMVSQPAGGCIINLGDWATVRPYLDHAAYFPSKGAIETMTRSLAVELGSRNPRVRVNCIQPGPVLLAADVDGEKRAKIADSVLLKKVGSAQQIAHAVQFLCENDFVTGVTLPVDGGRSIFANDGMQAGLNTG